MSAIYTLTSAAALRPGDIVGTNSRQQQTMIYSEILSISIGAAQHRPLNGWYAGQTRTMTLIEGYKYAVYQWADITIWCGGYEPVGIMEEQTA